MKFSQILAPLFVIFATMRVWLDTFRRAFFGPTLAQVRVAPAMAILAAFGVCLAVALQPAAAQTVNTPGDGQVIIPWGQWVADFIQGSAVLIAGWIAVALRHAPTELTWALRTFRLNELIDKSLAYAINVTEGAVRDKKLTAHITNDVLEQAFEYAIRAAPDFIKKIGVLDTLKEKIVARMNVEANVKWDIDPPDTSLAAPA